MTARTALAFALFLSSPFAAAAAGELDACALILGPEVEAVQGEALVVAKPNTRASGGLLFAQCYYAMASNENSVSLQVTLSDPGASAPASPTTHWDEAFHAATGPFRDKEAPEPVGDLGDEAFWASDAVVGVLYARKGDAFLRISVGGADAEEAKLEKSKTLARKALERL